MTVETLPWSVQGQSHPATVARNAQAGLLGAPVAAVSPAVQILTAGGGHGVTGSGDLAVAQNGTPNMSVNVAAGRAFIRGTETASLGQGVYSFFNDATVNLTIGAADPTNPRRDLIVAQVRDLNYSGAVSDARLAVIAGTAAASPSDPTPPANALVLARVTVAAGVTSVTTAAITDLRTRAASLGGVQVCTSTTRPSGASLDDGDLIYETDTKEMLQWYATPAVFRRPWNMPWGRVATGSSVTPAASGVSNTLVDIGLSATFTAVANRRYKVNVLIARATAPASNCTFTTTLVNAAGTLLQYLAFNSVPASNSFPISSAGEFTGIAAGSYTFKVQGTTDIASAGTYQTSGFGSSILVEDIGPASSTPA
jgi:hypothetical protein